MRLQINKEVTLFFNQIERDFTTAFIPTLHKKPEPDKKTKAKSNAKEKTKKEKKTVFFLAKTYGEETVTKVGEKKYELFKEASMVNTNPLQVWGEQRSRLVRVGYKLVKNKKKSTQDNSVFDLVRKETTNLHNTNFSPKEAKKQKIRTNIVATNIKELFISYIFPQEKKKTDKTEKKYSLELMTWGLGEETINTVPQQVLIHITFFGTNQKETKTFKCMIPIFSYPAPKLKKKKPKPEKKRQRQ
jgi:hypothetical protein